VDENVNPKKQIEWQPISGFVRGIGADESRMCKKRSEIITDVKKPGQTIKMSLRSCLDELE
jgi:hypothetical protein